MAEEPVHIGFTGTQMGMTSIQQERLREVLQSIGATHLHIGDCIGADDQCRLISLGVKPRPRLVGHPPDRHDKRAMGLFDEARPPRPYLVRNHDIVDECSGLIVAPKGMEEELRSGTWATYRYCREKMKTTIVIYPDGSISWHTN